VSLGSSWLDHMPAGWIEATKAGRGTQGRVCRASAFAEHHRIEATRHLIGAKEWKARGRELERTNLPSPGAGAQQHQTAEGKDTDGAHPPEGVGVGGRRFRFVVEDRPASGVRWDTDGLDIRPPTSVSTTK
jgi:hypothetical protein